MKKLLSVASMLLTIVAPFVVYYLSTSDRSMSYEIISNFDLINHYDGLSESEIELRYGNKTVENVTLSILRITNTGSEPIRQNDYESPIDIRFDSSVEILRAKILRKSPENLNIHLSTNHQTISVAPLLLNAEEYFELEILTSSPALPIVEARIAGINEVKETSHDSKKDWVYYYSVIFGILLIVLYGAIFWRAFKVSEQKALDFISALICCAGGILLLREWSALFSSDLIFFLVISSFSGLGGVIQLFHSRKRRELLTSRLG